MPECQECRGTGYISYVAFYDNMKVNDHRACKCLNDFLNKSTPQEIIQFIKNRLKTSNAKDVTVLNEVYPEQCPF